MGWLTGWAYRKRHVVEPYIADSAIFNRQTVLIPTLACEQNNVGEPNVLYEGNPQILTGETTVYKMWYGGGWGTPCICYAESVDGITWTKYGSNPILNNLAHPNLRKIDGTYYLYVNNSAGTAVHLYTSTDGVNFILDTSNVLTVGSSGQWDSQSIAHFMVRKMGEGDWKGLYCGQYNNYWKVGYATSSDGRSWTKYEGNPVLSTGPMYGFGRPDWHLIDSTYWLWVTYITFPVPLYRYYSSNLINWTMSPEGPVFSPKGEEEGEGSQYGGLGDFNNLDVEGVVHRYYGATESSQVPGQIIRLGTWTGTLATLVGTSEEFSTVAYGTNYQMRIRVHYGSGSDSGEDVYLNNKCRSDFGDVRITSSDGSSLLDCWVQEKTDSDYAIIWFEIAEELNTDRSVYVYYGNSSATYPYGDDQDEMDATFLFADHFYGTALDLTKWVNQPSGVTVAGSKVTINPTSWAWIKTINAFGPSIAAYYKAEIPSGASGKGGVMHLRQTAQDDYNQLELFYGDAANLMRLFKNGVSTSPTTNLDTTERVWSICWQVDRVSWFKDGTEMTGSPVTSTSYIPVIAIANRLTGKGGSGFGIICDWTFIKKYAYPEPGHGEWGSEEVPLGTKPSSGITNLLEALDLI